jgi:transposase-like protein
MADGGIVALREALGKILEVEHADLLREGVGLLYRELMEAEVANQAGAERYERCDERLAYRTGTGRGR